VDLGCGTGELTRQLHEHLRASETTGLDSSDNMLGTAARFAGEGLRFLKSDIRDFAAEGELDLVFSNAALHWVPDHEALFARLTTMLAAEGQLAVQLPEMEDHAAHIVAADVATRRPFRDELGGFSHRVEVHAPEWYAALLHRLGYREQHVRLQVYPHILPSREAVVDWYRGSLLTAYQARLSAEGFERFVEVYRTELMSRLPDDRPFFFGFKRILLWGQRHA
jgi:trans-aconitate 2-methyltransferase